MLKVYRKHLDKESAKNIRKMIDEEKNEIYVSKWSKDDLQLWHAPHPKATRTQSKRPLNARLKLLPMTNPASGREKNESDINGLRKKNWI